MRFGRPLSKNCVDARERKFPTFIGNSTYEDRSLTLVLRDAIAGLKVSGGARWRLSLIRREMRCQTCISAAIFLRSRFD
jgi:hypothetical protein